jgi:hypothetical protein
MSLFLSEDESNVLKKLERTLPEGIHKTHQTFLLGARQALLTEGFVVESDGGYIYCTARGLKYLQDQISGVLANDPFEPKLTFWQKAKKLLSRRVAIVTWDASK